MCYLPLMWLACRVLLVYTVSVRAHELSENKEVTKYEPLLSMVVNYFSHLEHTPMHLLRLCS